MQIHVIRPIPPQAVAFIKAREACRLTAYIDSAGVLTIGYGHTGPEVHLGMTITQEQADTYLQNDLATAAHRLELKIGDVVMALTDNQYSALISFVFNLGTDTPGKPEWKIWGYLRARQFDQAFAEMPKFCNARGRKVQGLVNRRAAEQALWSQGEPGTDNIDLPSSTTRAVVTQPTPGIVKPLGESKRFIATCATACLTGASAVAGQAKPFLDQVNEAITPYVGKSELVTAAAGHLATAAAIVSAISIGLFMLQQHKDKAQ